MRIEIPKEVELILENFNSNGYEAYIVGGCVRDSLFEKPRIVNDWDICTQCDPQKTIEICSSLGKVITTGLKHGTVTLVINSSHFEITTFRNDGEYIDLRRPENVEFVSDIKTDLARRDFTVNAMAYSHQTGVIDFFGGRKDLKDNVLRCVGNPNKRFNEDALRIMRALRFSATYGFEIEHETSESIHKNKNLIKKIAVERINSEFCKMIVSENFGFVFTQYIDIFGVIIPEIEKIIELDKFDLINQMAEKVSNADKDFVTRLAIFYINICKFLDIKSEEDEVKVLANLLKNMKFSCATIKDITLLFGEFNTEILADKKSIKKILSRLDSELFFKLLNIKYVCEKPNQINKKEIESLTKEILENRECFTLKTLAVNGRDLASVGVKNGEEIGKILKALLELVIEEKIENDKLILIDKAVDIHNQLLLAKGEYYV